jgi:hypothetical protein
MTRPKMAKIQFIYRTRPTTKKNKNISMAIGFGICLLISLLPHLLLYMK